MTHWNDHFTSQKRYFTNYGLIIDVFITTFKQINDMRTSLLLVLFLVITGCQEKPAKIDIAISSPEEVITINGITINDPKTEANLSIFILSGKEEIDGKPYKTLSEAMEAKEVTVKETGSVNQLSIDNDSQFYVFIHSGDIVKGGKQDRTIAFDIIIPPKTKNIPLESFCVEQGRWRQRSNENVSTFSANTKMLSSKDLKLAAKHANNQGVVWQKVSEQSTSLNKNLSDKSGYAVDVTDNESDSSLQLALESKELKKSRDSIFEKLKPLIKTPDAIGFAYTINGEIYGIEVYNNKSLFTDLWDKLLESVIVEAISKEGEDLTTEASKKDVATYMNAVKQNDKKTDKKLNKITNLKTIKNDKGNIVFITEDLEKQNWIHKSYMTVDTSTPKKNEMQYENNRLSNGN
ncbi:DUF6569 family protein [Winogradskyella sp. 3972H.M.0a.05]|uniref:ARPP-1 family domain-containing protein n=1 Tax=Winogradskyella sp. 3972H.M.0a.05 TaxID=2950277 RepID=UPI003395DD2D